MAAVAHVSGPAGEAPLVFLIHFFAPLSDGCNLLMALTSVLLYYSAVQVWPSGSLCAGRKMIWCCLNTHSPMRNWLSCSTNRCPEEENTSDHIDQGSCRGLTKAGRLESQDGDKKDQRQICCLSGNYQWCRSTPAIEQLISH